jgi:HD-GYP domain-containing protein (c-di-GMP phosphodiesterase class II)
MLVIPMRDHQDKVIGVVQLINKKRDPKAVLRPVTLVDEMVVPFTSVDEELVTSLASQAAVAFENTKLIRDIKNLFESFVSAAVTAIEQRDPTTSGHSERVAILTVGLIERVDAIAFGPLADLRFTPDQVEEVRYAALLHDFGKVGVREDVLVKAEKLHPHELELVRARFDLARASLVNARLRARLEGRGEADLAERARELDVLLEAVVAANRPTVLPAEASARLRDAAALTFVDLGGEARPLLTPRELASLSIPRGSLSEAERKEIEAHVGHTYRFLSQIPWTRALRRVPEIAYAHHEKLDGRGYPRGVPPEAIPVEARMMTIADIFDALTASDRPYKKAMPVERALDVLRDEARRGQLDAPLLGVFVEAAVWRDALGR